MADFKIPSFLENQTVDDVHLRMMENLPEDIDTSEGGHVWNLTHPHAYEKAYMVEDILVEAIKQIWPEFCEDYPETMDYHAGSRKMARKQAEYAVGTITILGPEGVQIPAGSTFSTISINDQPSIDFITTEEASIDSTGSVNIPIQAVEAGISGNVAANTIVLNASEIDDIETVINVEPTFGGMEEETTESLQARIMEHDQTIEESYGGSPYDYKRWALSVQGTGSAVVVSPSDDTTPIIIVLTDATGAPASAELCREVYNYIMQPDYPDLRLAPINDQLSVLPPSTINLSVAATIELEEGYTLDQAVEEFVGAMKQYIIEALAESEIKYSGVYGLLSRMNSVNDHKGLTLNGGTSNIAISSSEVPSVSTEDVTFTIGTV